MYVHVFDLKMDLAEWAIQKTNDIYIYKKMCKKRSVISIAIQMKTKMKETK